MTPRHTRCSSPVVQDQRVVDWLDKYKEVAMLTPEMHKGLCHSVLYVLKNGECGREAKSEPWKAIEKCIILLSCVLGYEPCQNVHEILSSQKT